MRTARPETESTPWEHGAYSIKRHGISITNCDAEPVQTPGCIQSPGVMLVARCDDLVIVQVSENSAALLGQSPEQLQGAAISAVIGAAGERQLRELMKRNGTEANPLYAFTMDARGEVPPLDVVVHTIDGVAIIEFEPVRQTSGPPRDGYELVKRSVGRLRGATKLQEFCTIVSEEFRELTGFDRVLVYKFHEDGHGEVFAESRRDGLTSWLGLHYPAGDIPKPARDVFRQLWIRPVPDVNGGLAELVPLVNPETGRPLTMTYSALRGASIMYTEYLRNMGVTAAVTMSLRHGDRLWGLIAAHHYSGTAHLSLPVRAACEFLAQIVSMQHQAVEAQELLGYRLKLEVTHQQLIAQAATDGGLSAMTESVPTLLDALDATGAALYTNGRWMRVGATPEDDELDAMAQWLSTREEFESPTRPVYATDKLVEDYPAGASLTAVASGVLAIPLSRSRRSLVLWFREETSQSIRWAGNPEDKPMVPGPNGTRLTPRRSFELFLESVTGRVLPWRAVEIDMALRFRTLVMELVLSRAERVADLNTELVRSNEELDAFAYVASHDLKEPLRGMYKYAHQLLEDAALQGADQQQKLERLMRLTLRMDALLDSLLHFSRVGRMALHMEIVDLNSVLAEAIEIVDARRSERPNEIVVPRLLPSATCDRIRVREIMTNLLSNALKYNDKPVCRIEVGFVDGHDDDHSAHRPANASGLTAYYMRDNGIGIEPRHADQVFNMFKRLHGRDEYGGGTGAGLTIVKRLVQRHGGEIWIDSIPGDGTTFWFTLEQATGQ